MIVFHPNTQSSSCQERAWLGSSLEGAADVSWEKEVLEPRIKIISGGQTGVDRGALDAAIDMGMPCGGWCPAGRADEEGTIPIHYPLRELPLGGYKARTIRNLLEADGTLILYFGALEGGTELTALHCMKYRRPYRLVDGWEITPERTAELVLDFVRERDLRSLNVAGPRASRRPEGRAYAYEAVRCLYTFLQRSMVTGVPTVTLREKASAM